MASTKTSSKDFRKVTAEQAVIQHLQRQQIVVSAHGDADPHSRLYAYLSKPEQGVDLQIRISGGLQWTWDGPVRASHGTDIWVFVWMPSQSLSDKRQAKGQGSDDPQPSFAIEASGAETQTGVNAPTARFFVMTTDELDQALAETANNYLEQYRSRHGREYGKNSTPKLRFYQASRYEDQWSKVKDTLQRLSGSSTA